METRTQPVFSLSEETMGALEAHPRRAKLFGVFLVVLGAMCVAFPWVSTLAAQTLVAAALIAAGAVEMYYAATMSPWGKKTRIVSGVSGLLALAAGAILIVFPLAGLLTLTVFVCAAFLLSGSMRIAIAVRAKGHPGRMFLGVSGALSVLLSVIIFAGLPLTAFWILGLILGADLLAHGVALIALTSAVTRQRKHQNDQRDDQRVEQASWESFPASDPPGFGR